MNPWFEISNADAVNTPALLIYPDRVQANLRRMIEQAGGVERLRPHVKTHKLPQIIQLKRQLGIRRFKVSTIAEAEMTAAAGGEDILLTCQPVGPNVRRLIELMRRFPATKFSALVDDPGQLGRVAAAATEAGVTVWLFVDLNVGMNRTGVEPSLAAPLYRLLSATAGVQAGGLHAYDGHLTNTDHAALRRSVETVFAPVWELRDQLRREGFPVPRTVASGTPTFPLLAEHDDVEVGCGTTVLWDFGQAAICPDLQFQHAAMLMTRVISKPAAGRLCLDLGHKSVASEMPQPRVRLMGLEDAEIVGHNEEHLVIRTSKASQYELGDVVYGIPRHVCPTVALHQDVQVVRDGAVTESWPVVARIRKITI